MIALNLTINKEWYDLIRIGVKKEEYRTFRNKAALGLFNTVARHGRMPDNPIAVLRNGYNMGSAAVAVEIVGLSLRNGDEVQHPEWGEPTDRELHMVIKLGKVLMIAPYYDIKEALRKEAHHDLRLRP